MAYAGIDYSILSLPTPHIYRGNAALSHKVARAINEEMARLVEAYPDKFGFVATIPLPDVEGSLEEIRYATEELLHPSPARELPRENVVTGKVMALFEYPADTTRAVLNLLANESGGIVICETVNLCLIF